jgi:hypothetical protein
MLSWLPILIHIGYKNLSVNKQIYSHISKAGFWAAPERRIARSSGRVPAAAV